MPRRIKSAYLSDDQVVKLARDAAKLRAAHSAPGLFDDPAGDESADTEPA
jgi:hypothetical protein